MSYKGLITDYDVFLFKSGEHFNLYNKFGSHLTSDGVHFAVWAPNAQEVSVIGDFNSWNPSSNALSARWDNSGIWEGFIPGIGKGANYKYKIISRYNNYQVEKGDPFAFFWEMPPRTASCVWDLSYEWGDKQWMRERSKFNSLRSPISIYEVHLGSWRRVPEEGGRHLTYREMAYHLASYAKEMGWTHIELMPVMEHPFYGSWGYQCTGYFAPTSRYGTPQDFMFLVDYLHQNNIGVILDWVPSHFPDNEYGLHFFDGTYLYEHQDPKLGFHPHWKSYIFNLGRWEVKNFLISSALFWLEKYHIDGLRMDAVASLLYLDYGREHCDWIPNKYGGRENIEAINFVRRLNEVSYQNYPDVQMIAEESTAWPMVSRPTYLGGLGFGMKWNMGWMHDTLNYFSQDPIYRKYYHHQLTFSIWYAFWENFVLSLSHDEVVHGKGSLLSKMPGDNWQKFANLRALFGYMFAHPGKKLIFMGGEFGQWSEWYHEVSLDWHLLSYPLHQGLQKWIKDLNYLYQTEPALYEMDFEINGFEWVDFHDWEGSIISFLRKGRNAHSVILVICNFTPIPRYNYKIGVPFGGKWCEVLNSDAEIYGGSNCGNLGRIIAAPAPEWGKYHCLSLTLPPLSVLFFKNEV
ncbi:MAG: 1,4-alpha-glucan branching enzyme GlgB [candidate division WS2 bacterium]|nr:1,4-alpha-glucan branching enzyme GlgB [Candidatus Lithacetigena glycinireducens]